MNAMTVSFPDTDPLWTIEQLWLEPEDDMERDMIRRLQRSGLGGHRGDPQVWWGDIEIGGEGGRMSGGLKMSWRIAAPVAAQQVENAEHPDVAVTAADLAHE